MKFVISMKHPRRWLTISVVTIIVSMAVIVGVGPTWGIDFVGGSLLEVEATDKSPQEIRSLLQGEFGLEVTTQPTTDGTMIIRTGELTEDRHQEVLTRLQEGQFAGEEVRFENIGPTIGQELRRQSLFAIALVAIMMIVYLAYTFRDTKGVAAPWMFGVAAVYALLHDLVLVTALYVLAGKLWGATIDTLFVTAQLAILGYSVNDTIVLFHRLKTEWQKGRAMTALEALRIALQRTLGRSLNTAFTTLLVLLALLLFGGATIRWFVLALTLGTITGTYSSLFVAPPLLLALAKRKR